MRVTREGGGRIDVVFIFVITYHNIRVYRFENINKIVCIFKLLMSSCQFYSHFGHVSCPLGSFHLPLLFGVVRQNQHGIGSVRLRGNRIIWTIDVTLR